MSSRLTARTTTITLATAGALVAGTLIPVVMVSGSGTPAGAGGSPPGLSAATGMAGMASAAAVLPGLSGASLPGLPAAAQSGQRSAAGAAATEPPKRRSTTKIGMTVEPAARKAPTVGIAYPLIVRFEAPVKRRGPVEQGLTVTVDGQPIVGAWSWRSPTTVMYRPKGGFWPAKSRVTLHAELAGTVVARYGAKKRKHVVANGSATRTVSFKTARSFVAKINDRTHRMVVRKNGKKIKTIPVSMGKPGFLTRSGIKVATTKYVTKRMVNQGLGYDVMSPWSVQITPTGEYIHGAPWAYGRIGRYNGSHGCVNLFVSDAKWYYDRVMLGDPVITKGTGRSMEWDNGLGGPWNIPWKEWLKRSALKGRTG